MFILNKLFNNKFFKYSNNYRTFKSIKMRLLNQEEATNIDLELFNEYKFSVDQLMELAGLSCAHAIYKCFPPETHKNVLICCGPGNNGGDGLVTARHLLLMNYTPKVYYPKRTEKSLYKNLTHQCSEMGIELLDQCPDIEQTKTMYQLIVDALFGFSFKPPVRELFVPIIEIMKLSNLPIASIDIPSGWDVEERPHDNTIKPQLLISLTAPKLCAQYFNGKYHYLGGRFVPDKLKQKYQLNLPNYEGNECCVKIEFEM